MLASIDATGQPRTATLRWQLFAEKWDYQWFRQDGDWKYQRTLIETPVDAGELAAAEAAGARVHRHPPDKDATDLALALDLVLARAVGAPGGRRVDVTVIGGHGGRADHLLGNALLLGSERYAPLRLRALWGGAVLRVVRDAQVLDGAPDGLVSLLALRRGCASPWTAPSCGPGPRSASRTG